MSLKLYYHPLSSFCQKVLIALYENDTPFEPHLVDLADATSRADFLKVWPIGKFPVLRDDAKDRTVPESSIIIEYLGQHYPGRTPLVPADAELAWQTRLRDRFYDLHVHEPHAEDRRRQAAAGDKQRSVRRGAGEGPAADRLRHDRRGDGNEDLGHGGCVQHGRLRRRAGAVLRKPGGAVWRDPQERSGVLRPADETSVLRPGGRGGKAVLRDVSEV